MPTYEYECQKCGLRLEEFKKISDPPRQRCPECRGKVTRLLGTGAGLLFKGSGFYITDYRSKSYKEGAKSDSAAGSAASSDASSKAHAKSPAKGSGAKP